MPDAPQGETGEPVKRKPDEATASFILEGDRLEPEVVTNALGLPPSHAHRKGDPRPRSEESPYRTGQWSLSSETGERSMEDHVIEVLEQLGSKESTIGQLCSEWDLDARFSFGYFMGRWNTGFILSPSTLERMAAFNAALWLDIYGAGWDE